MKNAFTQALLTAALDDCSPIATEGEVSFSPSFEKKMEKLCRKTDLRVFHPVRTAFRRAILIAALLAALAVTAMAVPSIRNAIINFFVHDEGTHYEFTFDPEQAATAPKQIEKVYRPMYIPDGFTLTDSPIVSTGAVCYIWYSDAFSDIGDYITFDQYILSPDPPSIITNAENVAAKTIEINGLQVFCVYDYGVIYHWSDGEYFFMLYCDPGISEEERNHIFSSIAIDTDIPVPE